MHIATCRVSTANVSLGNAAVHSLARCSTIKHRYLCSGNRYENVATWSLPAKSLSKKTLSERPYCRVVYFTLRWYCSLLSRTLVLRYPPTVVYPCRVVCPTLRWYCVLLNPTLELQSPPNVVYPCLGLPLRGSTPCCGLHPAGVNILGCSLFTMFCT